MPEPDICGYDGTCAGGGSGDVCDCGCAGMIETTKFTYKNPSLTVNPYLGIILKWSI